jgi:hypothetical protein
MGQKTTTVLIHGRSGTAALQFPAETWAGMSPVSRILAIHDKARVATGGAPFDIVSVRTN